MDSSVLADKRVLVVGDCMLDQYWFGDAERISPEAPVPVVRVLRTDARLGAPPMSRSTSPHSAPKLLL